MGESHGKVREPSGRMRCCSAVCGCGNAGVGAGGPADRRAMGAVSEIWHAAPPTAPDYRGARGQPRWRSPGSHALDQARQVPSLLAKRCVEIGGPGTPGQRAGPRLCQRLHTAAPPAAWLAPLLRQAGLAPRGAPGAHCPANRGALVAADRRRPVRRCGDTRKSRHRAPTNTSPHRDQPPGHPAGNDDHFFGSGISPTISILPLRASGTISRAARVVGGCERPVRATLRCARHDSSGGGPCRAAEIRSRAHLVESDF